MAKPFFLPKKVSGKMLVLFFTLMILLIAVAPGYYFYMQYQKTQKLLENPTDAAKEEVITITEKVGDLMLLPKDEEPTLATVSDKSKLANQAFFANAENGDKVLIFTKSKKAYLYRPSIDKVIDVAPVNIGATAPSPQPLQVSGSGTPAPSVSVSPTAKASTTPTVTPTPTSIYKKVNVALYNGTKTVGLAANVQTKLRTSAPNVTVVAKGNSVNNYDESVIVDFTGKYKAEAQQLAKLTGGSLGVLPRGEVKPTADILIILGPQQ